MSSMSSAALPTDPSGGVELRVGVVGAGLAGLAAARRLTERGHGVVLFDKARRPGGRCAARGEEGASFDHGAQYFTARGAEFRRVVARWCELGVVAPWKARLVRMGDGRVVPAGTSDERYVGVPDMNALPRHLAHGLEVRTNTRIAALERDERGGTWLLRDSERRAHGPFHGLVVTLPGPQAAALLEGHGPLRERAAGIDMAPCWAAWGRFEEAPGALAGFDGAFVDGGPLAWVARDSTKPGRAGERWMLHASTDWSREHFEASPEWVVKELFAALGALTGELPSPSESRAHRWAYSQPLGVQAEADPAPFDAERSLVLAGDAYLGGRCEGAWTSGVAAAERICRGGPLESSSDP
jgi:predicted NAD/FAD-dependent oxidoreductase